MRLSGVARTIAPAASRRFASLGRSAWRPRRNRGREQGFGNIRPVKRDSLPSGSHHVLYASLDFLSHMPFLFKEDDIGNQYLDSVTAHRQKRTHLGLRARGPSIARLYPAASESFASSLSLRRLNVCRGPLCSRPRLPLAGPGRGFRSESRLEVKPNVHPQRWNATDSRPRWRPGHVGREIPPPSLPQRSPGACVEPISGAKMARPVQNAKNASSLLTPRHKLRWWP